MASPDPVLLRLTARCNSGCAHCPVADLRELPELPLAEAAARIERGRAEGARELVFQRGEATLVRGLLKLVRRARELGYERITLETNGRMLTYPEYVEKLTDAGLTDVAQSVFAHVAPLHDAIDGTAGAFEQAMAGMARVLDSPLRLEVRVPVVRRNHVLLVEIVDELARLGVRRATFELPRPVKVGPAWQVGALVRMDDAAPFLRDALARAEAMGLEARTIGFPLCQLGARGTTQARRDVASTGPAAAVCEGCAALEACPRTWGSYQQVFGTWELRPLATAP
ncbi:MAG: radical SAM protein [Deltaproteobacteria bacterium]|nr:radical SAM protein [Deltaproteobacteria bacterium]